MEELLNQITKYLESKIPEVSKSTRDEITAYLIYRFAIHELETTNKINREWKQQLLGRRIDNFRRDIARTSVCPMFFERRK